MKIALSHIRKNSANEPYTFDQYTDVTELVSMNNDIRRIDEVHVTGSADMQGDEIIFTLVLDGEMILPCARTLVDVPYPFHIETTEVFSTSPYYGEEEEEAEIHPVDGEMLDLMPYIKENILLEVPFRVFAEEADPEEAAPSEGNGWEFVSEEQETEEEKSIDPRMQKLESLLKNKKEK